MTMRMIDGHNYVHGKGAVRMQRTSSRHSEHPIPEMSARYQQLRAALEQWAVLPEPQWAALRPIFHTRTIRSQLRKIRRLESRQPSCRRGLRKRGPWPRSQQR